MAQFDFAEENSIEIGRVGFFPEELTPIEPTAVMTGGTDQKRFLYYQLRNSMEAANQIDIIVSFLMESGVRIILDDLKNALDRGAQIRILTGNYLGITQPSALFLVKRELGNRVDLRFYNDQRRSFHPKSYIFHYENDREIYIGSSNISRSALTSGIEWNYRFNSRMDARNFTLFYETFLDLFENHSLVIDDAELRRYSKNWHKPAVAKDLEKYDLRDDEISKVVPIFRPRGAQIEALYALENSRAEGAGKGLVQAATGIGKTYLAAFDSAKYERVLFVAHREEILQQAARSFRNVRHSEDYGFFDRNRKDTGKAVVFASVATLGRREYLTEKYFAPDYFDYLVIDEFHHAVTDYYRRIVNYFKPEFLLGLTATPERMDGRSIYGICDYNVPYEISLKEAINKGMLVPFHYYGIYDDTDYSSLRPVKGHYAEKDLNKAFIGNYEKAGRTHLLLGGGTDISGNSPGDGGDNGAFGDKPCGGGDVEYPDDCIVDYDMRLIELFAEMEKKQLSVRERIRREYFRVKELLDGKVPTRMELFTHMDDAVYRYCMHHAKENPFRGYMDFLHGLGELPADEEAVYAGLGREFLSVIETTDMQKVYKMPILYSFYNHGKVRLAVTESDVLKSWKEFFDTGTNWKDFAEGMTFEDYKKMTDRQHLSKAKSMPIKFLKASGKGFFVEKEGYALAVREELADAAENAAFREQMGDILEYRTMEYYRRRYAGE